MPTPISELSDCDDLTTVGARLDREHSNVLDQNHLLIHISKLYSHSRQGSVGSKSRQVMSPHELSRPFDGYQIRQPASDVQGIKHNDILLVSEGSFDNCASTCHRIKNRACQGGRFIKVTKSGTPKIPHPEHSVLLPMISSSHDAASESQYW
ncbi:hypothetical protein BGY98DRAFT_147222 [Russula aff. rugulosa BPL654]|nr:hypothetical protein BGY98DRAFT_147222 [Russula aff. rugulosa BPL654]